jgi:hypothetical protein
MNLEHHSLGVLLAPESPDTPHQQPDIQRAFGAGAGAGGDLWRSKKVYKGTPAALGLTSVASMASVAYHNRKPFTPI